MMPLRQWVRHMLTPYRVNWCPSGADYEHGKDRQVITEPDKADVFSSEMVESRVLGDNRRHKLILDVDYPAYVVPTSTPGHHHIYLDVPGGIPHGQYMELVKLLGECNVIEAGYAHASIERGHTDLRPPGMRKGDEPNAPPKLHTEWVWEPDKEQAREEHVRVVAIESRGGECWVQTKGPTGTYWNSLDRFREAARRAS